MEMFAALHVGAPFGYATGPGRSHGRSLGNMVGGIGLVTAVRLLRVPHRVAEERDKAK